MYNIIFFNLIIWSLILKYNIWFELYSKYLDMVVIWFGNKVMKIYKYKIALQKEN